MGRVYACGSTRLAFFGLLFALTVVAPASATVHVVKFGGTIGLAYSPSAFSAAVGDTIRWQGDFSFHPLTSTTIPAGAAAWSNSSGTSFDYVVTVAGQYNYVCEVHQPAMSGSFTAILSSVPEGAVADPGMQFSLDQNYPNPFNPSTTIGYRQSAIGSRWVRLGVYDMLGRQIALLVDGSKAPGTYAVTFNGAHLSSGLYVSRLEVDGASTSRLMILMR